MRLEFRSTQDPTCPLCRESVFLLETRSCEGCRTDYHQACLEEFTGCSTLGCASTTYVEADLTSPELTPVLNGEIRVTARVPQPPSQIWLRAQRLWRGLGSAALGTARGVRAFLGRLDATLVALFLSLVTTAIFVISQGMTSTFKVTISEVVGIGLAILALGLVVFAAHAISSRTE